MTNWSTEAAGFGYVARVRVKVRAGLALYDKEQHGVRGKARNHKKPNGHTVSWILLSPEGEVISLHEDPIDYCKALRQVIEARGSPPPWSADARREPRACAR